MSPRGVTRWRWVKRGRRGQTSAPPPAGRPGRTPVSRRTSAVSDQTFVDPTSGTSESSGVSNSRHSEDDRRTGTSRASVLRLVRLFGTQKAKMAWVFVCVLISVVLAMVAPIVLGKVIDLIFSAARTGMRGLSDTAERTQGGSQDNGTARMGSTPATAGPTLNETNGWNTLARLIVLLLIVYILTQTFIWLYGRILNDVVMHAVYTLRQDVERKLHHLPLGYFDARKRGDILSRTTNDVDNIQSALQQAFAVFISSFLTVLGIITMMFWLSWQMALITLVSVPLSVVVVAIVGIKSEKLFTAQWATTGQLNAHIEETFTGHEVVTIFDHHAAQEERFDAYNNELFEASFKAQFYSGVILPSLQYISYLTYIGVAIVGALRITSGQMTLGSVTAFIQFSRDFSQSSNEIAGVSNLLISGVTSAKRVFEILDAKEERQNAVTDNEQSYAPSPHVPLSSRKHEGAVTFEHVTFSYENLSVKHDATIKDFSLTVQPGQTVALVGPTGAGKTTLVDLMMRFYEVQSGRICLDGIDTQLLDRRALRSQLGMVLQDAYLFHGTIRENIRYGRLDATDEEVVLAAKVSLVDHFVRSLPHGYDTVIEGQGASISAGQKQLITIARAFLADPAILILDEATSSVDTRTETLVQQGLVALKARRTVFIIAHRLSTIQDADLIVVIDHGRIIEQGSHSELMRKNGIYHRLRSAQVEAPQSAVGQNLHNAMISEPPTCDPAAEAAMVNDSDDPASIPLIKGAAITESALLSRVEVG